MKKSVGKNYLLNLAYQIIALLLPLLTAPYLSRTLNPSGIGQYGFTSSINYYLVLLAALGFGNYAQREIAQRQGDKMSQSVVFWEVVTLRLLSAGTAICISIVLFFSGAYQGYGSLMLFWLFTIAAEIFDITFFFQGNEEFAKIVWRNLLVKILSLAAIFLFVKKPTDVWVYVLITGVSKIIGNLSIWFYLPKFLVSTRGMQKKPLRHLLPTLRLFLPAIAVALYGQLDKTVMGIFVQGTYEAEVKEIVNGVETVSVITKRIADDEVGFYSSAESIVKIGVTIITAMGTVLIPRNSSLVSSEQNEKFQESFLFGTNFVWFLGMPIAFGLAAISSNFIPWFLGNDYLKSALLLKLLAPLVVLLGLTNAFGAQFMIPSRMDKEYAVCILIGALSNVVISIPLVYFYQSVGAALGTILAELICAASMAFVLRKRTNLLRVFKQSWKYLIAASVMFGVVFCLSFLFEPLPGFTALLIMIGIIIYPLMLLAMRDRFLIRCVSLVKTKLGHFRKKRTDNYDDKDL